MIRQVVYGFIYEMKQLILIMTYGTPNTNKFKSFIYKVILLENTETDWLNGIIRNTAISVLLKYLSYFWRSLEMSLINWKVELKCKWMSHCFCLQLALIMMTFTQWYVPVVTLSAQENQKLKKNCLANDLKDHCIGMTIKRKVRVNIREMSIYVISRIKICRC